MKLHLTKVYAGQWEYGARSLLKEPLKWAIVKTPERGSYGGLFWGLL